MANNKNKNLPRPKSNFLRNFGKATAYTSLDILKSITPVTTSAVTQTVDLVKDGKQTMRSFKAADLSQGGRAAKDLFTSAMNDIRDGNFSLHQNADQLYTDFNNDIAPDFDIEDADGGTKSSDRITADTNQAISKTVVQSGAAQIESIRTSTAAMSKALLQSNRGLGQSLVTSVQTQTSILNASLHQMERKLDAINGNLVQMIQFQNQNISVTNSALLDYMEKTSDMLSSMGKMMSRADYSSGYGRRPENVRDVVDQNGFNMDTYKKLVKENFSGSALGLGVSTGKMLQSMGSMGGGNPLKMLLTDVLLPSAVPKSIKKSIGSFDKHVSLYIQKTLEDLGDASFSSNNVVKQILGSIFGVKRVDNSGGIRMGAYSKDAMSWNGLAQKALVEVIPEYLASIERAITKTADKRYMDYDTGKFRTSSDIRKAYQDELASGGQRASGELMETMQRYIQAQGMNEKATKELFDRTDKLLNDRVNGSTRYDDRYKEELVDTLSGFNDTQFRKLTMLLEDAIRSAANTKSDTYRQIGRGQSVYRNINNMTGEEAYRNEGPTRFTENYRNVDSGGSGYVTMIYEILRDRYADILTDAQIGAISKKPDIVEIFKHDMLVYGAGSTTLINDVLEAASTHVNKARARKFFHMSDTPKENYITKNIENADNLVFNHVMGLNRSGRTPRVQVHNTGSNNSGSSDTGDGSGDSEPRSLGKPSHVYRHRSLDKSGRYQSNINQNLAASSNASRANGDVAGSRRENGIQSVQSTDNERKLNALHKTVTLAPFEDLMKKSGTTKLRSADGQLSRQLIEQEKDNKSNGEDSTTSAISRMSSSVRLAMLQTTHTMQNMSSKLFGEGGVLRNIWDSEWRKKEFEKLKEKLFNSKDGVFKDQVAGLKNLWTKTKGKLVDAYDFGYTNTMKYLYRNKEGNYQDQDSYKKYLKWMDIKGNIAVKKKKKEEEAAAVLAKRYGAVGGKSTNRNVVAQNNGEAVVVEDVVASSGSKAETQDKNIVESIKQDSLKVGGLYLNRAKSTVSKLASKLTEKDRQIKLVRKNGTSVIVSSADTPKIQAEMTSMLVDTTKETTDKISSAGKTFTDNMFGESVGKDGKETPADKTKKSKNFFDKFKSALPTALAAGIIGAGTVAMTGSMGLLGGLFLPTNAIGGAIVGIGTTLLSKTEAFQSLLFGKMGEDGQRQGGLLSKNLGQSFKKALPTIVGGAVLGGLKQIISPAGGPMGFLLGTLLPSGPLGGAILGLGLSVAKNSESFKSVLFGKADEDGKRSGTFLSKSFNKAKGGMLKVLPMMKKGIIGLGVGALTGTVMANMGVIPAAMSLGGPIGMGLAGLGIGIAASTKRFNNFLFGSQEFDEDGNPTGKRNKDGMLTRIRNIFTVKVFDPIAEKLSHTIKDFAAWTKLKIMYPFRLVFGPILDSLGGIKDNIVEFVKDKFSTVAETVTDVLKSTIKAVFKPFTSIANALGKGAIGAVAKAAKLALSPLSAILKIAQISTMGKRRGEYAEFYGNYIGRGKDFLVDKWKARDDTGEKNGVFRKIRDVGSVLFNPDNEYRAASRDGWNAGQAKYSRNSLNWRNVSAEKRETVEDIADREKQERRWRKIDKLRDHYTTKFGGRELTYRDSELADMQKKFAKLGIDTAYIPDSDAINDLIYHKSDFKKKYSGKNGRMLGVDQVVQTVETEEQLKSRLRTEKYQATIEAILKDIGAHFETLGAKNAEQHRVAEVEEYKKKQASKLKKRLEKMGLDPDELGVGFDDEVLEVTSDAFDAYRTSNEYLTGNFKHWFKKNKKNFAKSDDFIQEERDEINAESGDSAESVKKSIFRTKGGKKYKLNIGGQMEKSPEVVASEQTTAATEKVNATLTKLVQSNEEIAASTQDNAEASIAAVRLQTGGNITENAIRNDKVKESWFKKFSTNPNSTIGRFVNGFFGRKKKDDKEAAEIAAETEESKQASALGELTKQADGTADTSNKKEENAPKTTKKNKSFLGKLLGAAGGVISFAGGLLGSVFNGIGGNSLSQKLITGAFGLGLANRIWPSMGKNIKGLLEDKVLPFITDKLPSLLTSFGSFVMKHATSLIDSFVNVATVIMPSIVKGAASLAMAGIKATGGLIKDVFTGKGGGKDLTEDEAAAAIAEGRNVYQRKDGTFYEGGSREMIDADGNVTGIGRTGLTAGSTHLLTNVARGFLKGGTSAASASAMMKTIGRGAGMFVGGSAALGAPMLIGPAAGVGGRVGKRLGGTVGKAGAAIGEKVSNSALGLFTRSISDTRARNAVKHGAKAAADQAAAWAVSEGGETLTREATEKLVREAVEKSISEQVGKTITEQAGKTISKQVVDKATQSAVNSVFGRTANIISTASMKTASVVTSTISDSAITEALIKGASGSAAENVVKATFPTALTSASRAGLEGTATAVAREGAEAAVTAGAKAVVETTATTITKGVVESSNKSFLAKLFGKMASAFDKLAGNKLVGEAMSAAGESVVKQGFIGKLISALKELLTKVSSKVLSNEKLTNSLAGRLAKRVGASALKISPLGLIFTAFDAISGAFGAANLFGVDKSAVDGKMVFISTMFSVLLGIALVGPAFDVLLEVCSIVIGTDIKQQLASKIYMILASDEEDEDLLNAQAGIELERELYNAAHKSNISTDAYNDLKNIPWYKKLWNGARSIFTGKDYSVDYSKDITDEMLAKKTAELRAGVDGTEVFNSTMPTNSYTNGNEFVDEPTTGFVARNIGYGKAVGYGRGIPSYSQKDPKWSNYKLGYYPNGQTATMDSAGCGPTAMSMVASNLTGRRITPLSIAKLSQREGFISQGGANAGLFTVGAANMGLKPAPLRNSSDLVTGIASGKPVIISGKDSSGTTPFTKAGHIVVANGTDGHGGVRIKNPSDGSERSYQLSKIAPHVTNSWVYGASAKRNSLSGGKYRSSVGYGALPGDPGPMDITDIVNSALDIQANYVKYFDKSNSKSSVHLQNAKNLLGKIDYWIAHPEQTDDRQMLNTGDQKVLKGHSKWLHALLDEPDYKDLSKGNQEILALRSNIYDTAKHLMLETGGSLTPINSNANVPYTSAAPVSLLDIDLNKITNMPEATVTALKYFLPENLYTKLLAARKYYTADAAKAYMELYFEQCALRQSHPDYQPSQIELKPLVGDSSVFLNSGMGLTPDSASSDRPSHRVYNAALEELINSGVILAPGTGAILEPGKRKGSGSGRNKIPGLSSPNAYMSSPISTNPVYDTTDELLALSSNDKYRGSVTDSNYKILIYAEDLIAANQLGYVDNGIVRSLKTFLNSWPESDINGKKRARNALSKLMGGVAASQDQGLTETMLKLDETPYDSLTMHNGIPFYSIKDGLWAKLKYGRGTVESHGQDLATLAMMMSAYAQKSITPQYLLENILPRYDANIEGHTFDGKTLYNSTTGINWENILDPVYGIQNAPEMLVNENAPISVKYPEGRFNAVLDRLGNGQPIALKGYQYKGSLYGGTKVEDTRFSNENDAVNTLLANYIGSDGKADVSDPMNEEQSTNSAHWRPIDSILGMIGSQPIDGGTGVFRATVAPGWGLDYADGRKLPIKMTDTGDDDEGHDANTEDSSILSIFANFFGRVGKIIGSAVSAGVTGKPYKRTVIDEAGNWLDLKKSDETSSGTNNVIPTSAYGDRLASFLHSPTNAGDEITARTIQFMMERETGGSGGTAGYSAVAADSENEAGEKSTSLGAIMWNNSNAANILRSIHNALPSGSSAKSEIYPYIDKVSGYGKMTDADRSNLSAILGSAAVLPVAKDIQDKEIITTTGRDYVPFPMKKYSAGILKYPKSIIPIADISNTGVGYTKDFINNYYTPYTGSSELGEREHLISSISSWYKNKIKPDVYGTRFAAAKNYLGQFELNKQLTKDEAATWDHATGYGPAIGYGMIPYYRAQRAVVDKMASVKGKLRYTLTGPQNPDVGSGSCASTVSWAYNRELGVNYSPSSAINSAAQSTDPNFTTIWKRGDGNLSLNRLEPGDVMYQDWGNTGTIGHTQMYDGNGMIWSNGHEGQKNGTQHLPMSQGQMNAMRLIRRYTPFYKKSTVNIKDSYTSTPGMNFANSNLASYTSGTNFTNDTGSGYTSGSYTDDGGSYNDTENENANPNLTELQNFGADIGNMGTDMSNGITAAVHSLMNGRAVKDNLTDIQAGKNPTSLDFGGSWSQSTGYGDGPNNNRHSSYKKLQFISPFNSKNTSKRTIGYGNGTSSLVQGILKRDKDEFANRAMSLANTEVKRALSHAKSADSVIGYGPGAEVSTFVSSMPAPVIKQVQQKLEAVVKTGTIENKMDTMIDVLRTISSNGNGASTPASTTITQNTTNITQTDKSSKVVTSKARTQRPVDNSALRQAHDRIARI